MPLTNSSISKYEAKVESLLNDVEEEKRRLLEEAKKEADNIKIRAGLLIKDAEEKGHQIIENAKNQALNIIKQAEDEQNNIKLKTEEIAKNAYNEGFQKGLDDGLNKFREDAINSVKSLETLAAASFELKHNIVKSADMDIVELVMALEEEFDIEIPDSDAEKVVTVGDVVEYIKENVK